MGISGKIDKKYIGQEFLRNEGLDRNEGMRYEE
jgi:hypothetical protein